MMDRFAPIALLALAACSTNLSESPSVQDATVAEVRAYADGRTTLNGLAVTIEEIREAFAELSRNDGEVWYYREAADTEPHPNAILVFEEIMNARLPLMISTKPDDSDAVQADGSAKPRE